MHPTISEMFRFSSVLLFLLISVKASNHGNCKETSRNGKCQAPVICTNSSGGFLDWMEVTSPSCERVGNHCSKSTKYSEALNNEELHNITRKWQTDILQELNAKLMNLSNLFQGNLLKAEEELEDMKRSIEERAIGGQRNFSEKVSKLNSKLEELERNQSRFASFVEEEVDNIRIEIRKRAALASTQPQISTVVTTSTEDTTIRVTTDAPEVTSSHTNKKASTLSGEIAMASPTSKQYSSLTSASASSKQQDTIYTIADTPFPIISTEITATAEMTTSEEETVTKDREQYSSLTSTSASSKHQDTTYTTAETPFPIISTEITATAEMTTWEEETITKDGAETPFPIISTEITAAEEMTTSEEETVTKDEARCEISQGGKCYWFEISSEFNVSYASGAELCARDSGYPASIPDKELYDKLVTALTAAKQNFIFMWLGMRYDANVS